MSRLAQRVGKRCLRGGRLVVRLVVITSLVPWIGVAAPRSARDAAAGTPPYDTIDTIVGSELTPEPGMQPFGLVALGDGGSRVGVMDPINHVIRRLEFTREFCESVVRGKPVRGKDTYRGVLAGNEVAASGGDGDLLRRGELHGPYAMALGPVDSGFQYSYIADTFAHRIRVIAQSVGIDRTGPDTIRTLAGSTDFGFAGDGGPAGLARLNSPYGVAWDGARSVYIADTLNHRIRRIDLNEDRVSGSITTVAGTGVPGYAGVGDPEPAITARLNAPRHLEMGPNGALYIADTGNHIVRRYDPAAGTIQTVAGNGTPGYAAEGPATAVPLNRPTGLAFDPRGNLYVADTGNHLIRRISTSGQLTTVAGNRTAGFEGDGGPATKASLSSPFDVELVDGCGLLIADTGNNRIRLLDGTEEINTIAGNGTPSFDGAPRSPGAVELAGPGGVAQWAYTCPGTSESDPVSARATFILDTFNHTLRYVYESVGVAEVRTLVGNGTPAAAPSDKARFHTPVGLTIQAVPASRPEINLFVADTFSNVVKQVNWRPCGDAPPPTSVALPAGPGQQRPNPDVTILAGNGVPGYGGDGGPPGGAQVSFPMGVSIHESTLYVADSYNSRIRIIDLTASPRTITTLAGDGLNGFAGDRGAPDKARLHFPYGVAARDKAIYVADSFNHRVREIALRSNEIKTVIGDGIAGSNGDRLPPNETRLHRPWGVAVSETGVFVADYLNDRVREFGLDALRLDTAAGTGAAGFLGDAGPIAAAQINAPRAVWPDPFQGRFLIADTFNNRIRRVGTPLLELDPKRWHATVDGPALQTFTISNRGDGILLVDKVQIRDRTRRLSIPAAQDKCSKITLLPSRRCAFTVRFNGERGPAVTGDVRVRGRGSKLMLDIPVLVETAGIISGTKYEDRNGDGTRGPAEPGLDAWFIHLIGTDKQGVPVHLHSSTDANGGYRFDAPPGRYTVCETNQPGWSTSAISGAPCAQHTHNGEPNPYGFDIRLDSGDVRSTTDIGSFRPVSFRGVMYQDGGSPPNGQRDTTTSPLGDVTGEAGLAGSTIHLIGRDGAGRAVHMHTRTSEDDPQTAGDEAGRYTFHARPGRYRLCQTQDDAYELTQPRSGAACNGLDSIRLAPIGYAYPAAASGSEPVADFGNGPLSGPHLSVRGGGEVNTVGSSHRFVVRVTRGDGSTLTGAAGEVVHFSLDPGTSDGHFTSVGGAPSSGTRQDCTTRADDASTTRTDEAGTCEAILTASKPGTVKLTAQWQESTDSGSVARRVSTIKQFVDFDLRISPPSGTNALDAPTTFTVQLRRNTGRTMQPVPGRTIDLTLDPGATEAGFASVNRESAAGTRATCVTQHDRPATRANEAGTCVVSISSAGPGRLSLEGAFTTDLDSGRVMRRASAARNLVDFRLGATPSGAVTLVAEPRTFTVRLVRDDGDGSKGIGTAAVRLVVDPGPSGARLKAVNGRDTSEGAADCVTSADDPRTPRDEAGFCSATLTAARPGKAILRAAWSDRVDKTRVTRTASASTTFVRVAVEVTSCPADRSPRGGFVDYAISVSLTGAVLRDVAVTQQLPPEIELVATPPLGGSVARITAARNGPGVSWRLRSLSEGILATTVRTRIRDDAQPGTTVRSAVSIQAEGISRQIANTALLITQDPQASGGAHGVAVTRSDGPVVAPTPQSDPSGERQQGATSDPLGGKTALAKTMVVGESNQSTLDAAGYSATARAHDVNLTVPGVLRLQATSVVAQSTSVATVDGAEGSRGGSFIQNLRINGQPVGNVFNPTEVVIRDPVSGDAVAQVHLIETIDNSPAPGRGGAERLSAGLAVNGIRVVVPGASPTQYVLAHAETTASFPSGLTCVGERPRVAASASAARFDHYRTATGGPTATPSSVSQADLAPTGGRDEARSSNLDQPGYLQARNAEAAVSGSTSMGRAGPRAESEATAKLTDVTLLGEALKAGQIASRSRSESGVPVAGSSTIQDLHIQGMDLCSMIASRSGCQPAPNTGALIANGAMLVVLNEQRFESGTFTVNAVHIWVLSDSNPFRLPSGAEIVLAGARSFAGPAPVAPAAPAPAPVLVLASLARTPAGIAQKPASAKPEKPTTIIGLP